MTVPGETCAPSLTFRLVTVPEASEVIVDSDRYVKLAPWLLAMPFTVAEAVEDVESPPGLLTCIVTYLTIW